MTLVANFQIHLFGYKRNSFFSHHVNCFSSYALFFNSRDFSKYIFHKKIMSIVFPYIYIYSTYIYIASNSGQVKVVSNDLRFLICSPMVILFLKKKFSNSFIKLAEWLQKQPSRCVIRKRCFKNMQKIYRRTPIPKCDFNKIALHVLL